MSLQNEIREVLYSARGPLHPTIIRMRVLAARLEDDEAQTLETFNRAMRSMDDIESIKIDGLWYRMFKAQKEKTLCYRCRVILCAITVKGLTERLNNKITRVWSWLRYQALAVQRHLISAQTLGLLIRLVVCKRLLPKLRR